MTPIPASPEDRRPNESPSAACGRCGYVLTGLAPRSRCPECGARDAGGRIRDADALARSAYATITGVIWRSGVVVIGQVGFLVVAISIIRSFPGWIAIPVAVVAMLGVWFRTSVELDPDRGADGSSRLVRYLLRVFMLVGSAGYAVVAILPGFSGDAMIEFISISTMLLVGLGAALVGRRTAWWVQEDQGHAILEAAPWCYLLTIGGVVLVLGSHFAGLLPPAGIAATGPKLAMAAFVGGIGWGVCVLFADVQIFAASIRCLLHRAQYQATETRRDARLAEAEKEFDERVRRMDDDGTA